MNGWIFGSYGWIFGSLFSSLELFYHKNDLPGVLKYIFQIYLCNLKQIGTILKDLQLVELGALALGYSNFEIL